MEKIMNEPKVITISQTQYLELLDDQKLLDALRAVGVDNWQGWDDALDMYHGEGGDDE